MTSSKEWDAAAYQRLSAPQFAWGQKVLARLSLRGDEAALDVGCGTGRLTAELCERLPRGRVVALDLSENMVAEARKNLEPRFGDRVSFRAGDALSLDDREAFDLIFSTATFHWIRDHAKLFQVLFGALVPGGWLVAQCGGAGNLDRLHGIAERIQEQADFARYFHGWPGVWEFASPEVTAERLRAAGFTAIDAGLEEAPTPFESEEIFAGFLRAVVLRPHLGRLPDDELRARFLAEVVATAGRADPPYTLDYWRLNMKARRPQ